MPRTRAVAVGSTIQARARSDGRQIAAKASVPGTIGVTPLPARILSSSEVLNVTRRRQGGWDLIACSWNGHGDSWTWLRAAMVVWQRVAVGLIYTDAGRARRHIARGPPLNCSSATRRRKCGEETVE